MRGCFAPPARVRRGCGRGHRWRHASLAGGRLARLSEFMIASLPVSALTAVLGAESWQDLARENASVAEGHRGRAVA